MPAIDSPTAAISVSQLNRRVKTLIEQGLARFWVEGEISNLSRPASGHIYLTLKDDKAQVSAAWFRQRQRAAAIGFKNGDRVLAYGRVSLYEARGNYQLIIEQLEAAGEGVLKRRYDALKLKLSDEGLFAVERKRELPALPQRIGVITSPSGAAVRDVLSVLARRFPAVPVIIYPASVQGDSAPAELINALATAVERAECNVLILCRGGGSLEDLWAFNDEGLAHAISDCPLPIVSAIGHEVDFTIADFVADVRAATPSGAAELVVPDGHEWRRRIVTLATRIARANRLAFEDRAQQLDWLAKRLVASSPAITVQRQRDKLRENSGRLTAAMQQQLLQQTSTLQAATNRLIRQSPALTVQRLIARLSATKQRLAGATRTALEKRQHQLALLGRALHAVSPLATLQRGYAIVSDDTGRRVVSDATELESGQDVRARLSRGEIVATVKKVVADE